MPRLHYLVAVLAVLSACTLPAPSPDWIEIFGYSDTQVFPIEIGDFGYPYVTVTIDGQELMLPFDTGNMVGISLSPSNFDRLGITASDRYRRLDSAGNVVATSRIAEGVEVSLLDLDPDPSGELADLLELGPSRVFELEGTRQPGLVGPGFLEGAHFTLDYQSRRIAVGRSPLPDAVPGFEKVPLVRSRRHPTLILVHGRVEGREVLIELDTGKSRTVVNPELAKELGARPGADGVAIENLRISGLSFDVPRAKPVDQTGIDTGLSEPILAGIGSDILSRFVWTVDYEAGVLWLPSARP